MAEVSKVSLSTWSSYWRLSYFIVHICQPTTEIRNNAPTSRGKCEKPIDVGPCPAIATICTSASSSHLLTLNPGTMRYNEHRLLINPKHNRRRPVETHPRQPPTGMQSNDRNHEAPHQLYPTPKTASRATPPTATTSAERYRRPAKIPLLPHQHNLHHRRAGG